MTVGVIAAVMAAAGAGVAHADVQLQGPTRVDVREHKSHVVAAIVWKYAHKTEGNKWQARLTGRLYNDGNDHVYMKASAPYNDEATYAQKQGHGWVPLDVRMWPGDTLQLDFMTVTACESHWGPDWCTSKDADNPAVLAEEVVSPSTAPNAKGNAQK